MVVVTANAKLTDWQGSGNYIQRKRKSWLNAIVNNFVHNW